jgi:tRNA pseudouridine38-40 synthase
MRNLKITMSYDGTRYHGWQIQSQESTVQGELEEVLKRILKNGSFRIVASGRTDAGVHAREQVAHCRLPEEKTIQPIELKMALNSLLPWDIRILSAEEISPAFHAIRDCREKEYRYFIQNSEICSPFDYPYVWHIVRDLDLEAMGEAATLLEGEHDFSSFRSSSCSSPETRKAVSLSCLEPQGDKLIYRVRADGFLQYMVRIIVGTLFEVGKGTRSSGSIRRLLGGEPRDSAGPTAPARGLFLWEVTY